MADSVNFSDPGLLILTSLASGEKHGYSIIEDVEAFSGIRLVPGTLYGALARLEQKGWIEPLPPDDRRRPYRLTGVGDTYLREQLRSLSAITQTGLGRLGEAQG